MFAKTIGAPGDVVHVRDRVLAGALLSVGVKLKTELAGGEWAGVTNVYSEKHPARVNNIRVPGVETYYFKPVSEDGRVRTAVLVQAWNEAGELSEGDPQTQAEIEIEKIAEEILHADMTEGVRDDMAARLRFWHVVSQIQQMRVGLAHVRQLSSLLTDARKLPPMVQWKRPNGNTNFKNADASRL